MGLFGKKNPDDLMHRAMAFIEKATPKAPSGSSTRC